MGSLQVEVGVYEGHVGVHRSEHLSSRLTVEFVTHSHDEPLVIVEPIGTVGIDDVGVILVSPPVGVRIPTVFFTFVEHSEGITVV